MNRYSGLSSSEVEKSRKLYGTNEINNRNKNSFMKLLIESFGDPIIKILLIVLAVKTVFLFQNADWFETLGIVLAITLASFISTISEYGSEKAYAKMEEEARKIKCKVIRDNDYKEINVGDIVKGDIVLLEAGEQVGADGTILEGEIYADESSFTGESKEILKVCGSKVYRGSIVLRGNATIRVSDVGYDTKYGSIATEIMDKSPESPLRGKLRELASIISKIGYTGAILVFFSYLFSVIVVGNNFNIDAIIEVIKSPLFFNHIMYALTLAVTIVIVSVPDGLL